MLHPKAAAHATSAVVALLYLGTLVLAPVAPGLFSFLFNAQFFGADVAALLPKAPSVQEIMLTFLTLVVASWLLGYLWAVLYNSVERKKG